MPRSPAPEVTPPGTLQRLVRLSAPYVTTIAVVGVAGVAAAILDLTVPLTHVSILFIGAVLVSAVLWGFGPALFAIVLGVAAAAFFFYVPIYSFAVSQPQDIVDVILFVIVSILGARLAARGRHQTIEARRSEAHTKDLYAFSRKLAGIADPNDLYFTILDEIGRLLPGRILLLLPGEEALIIFSAYLSDQPMPEAARAEAERIWRAADPTGEHRFAAGTEHWRFRILRTGRGRVGILAISGADQHQARESAHLDSVIDQASIAIERTQLAAKIEDARVEERAEKLREALLNSISHDLQTPLASIIGSATALQSFGTIYDERAREELMATIREEADRLNHVIRNTLDLSRIRAGDIAPRLELVEPADIVNAALRRAQRTLSDRSITVEMPSDLPMLRLDLFLTEQALVNLLENAVKYSPSSTPVRLAVRANGPSVEIDVADEGVGLAPGERHRIFDRFYRVTRPDAQPAGTGLGLAIARAFIDATGGRIEVLSAGTGAGTTFRVILPIPEETAVDDEAR